MADISLIQDECMDDADEGVFEQGDSSSGSSGSPENEDHLHPLSRIQYFAGSPSVYDRQMVFRVVQEAFRTTPAEILEEEIPKIMTIVRNLGEKDRDPMLRTDLLEQIPHMASQALKYSTRVQALENIISEYLLPLVVRNLGHCDNAVDKAAHTTLINLLQEGLITKPQAEIQVCPAILALSSDEQSTDIDTGAITLMGRLAPLLGRDVTERVFLKRFSELCTSPMFFARKVCASNIGDFCAVVGKEQFEKVLLPCYLTLCQDEIWGVRKSCADVIMFVSNFSTPEIRRFVLAKAFDTLLKDECRWVQMAAFQTLGPFIASFANPSITSTAYNAQGQLVFVNKEGNEFLMKTASTTTSDIHFFKYLPRQTPPLNTNLDKSESDVMGDWWQTDDDEVMEKSAQETIESTPSFSLNTVDVGQTDEDIKELVETVKKAVLSYRSVEEQDVIGDNVINNTKSCDNLEDNFESLSLSTSKDEEVTHIEIKQVKAEEDDASLDLYNSYYYWYISPDLPVDLTIFEQGLTPSGTDSDSTLTIVEDISLSFSEVGAERSKTVLDAGEESENSELVLNSQNIVPAVLINHFFLMTDTSFTINIDCEMPYYCAYSLPAVALTLEEKSWPLLKDTIERLASFMQYKVRRTVASSLHELAIILGTDIASDHLTPIFEGFIKDLDEVRIGILKHMACFLKIIKAEKRKCLLRKLGEFVKTENESNWRFRHELAKQLLEIVTLFNPVDSAKHIGVIAESLLLDVSAVRQAAIAVITELLRHISDKPGLISLYLVRIVEHFAHSKKWNRRQTFALLCQKVVSAQALPPDQFASEIMPHLLDLSWDPVANVRLVVAKTLSQHVIPNVYFADPSNQHFDSIGTVIRRLQADKDRDVRFFAEVGRQFSDRSMSPPLTYDLD